MTAHNTAPQRLRMARTACFVAAALLLLFSVAGNLIFRFLGITLPAPAKVPEVAPAPAAPAADAPAGETPAAEAPAPAPAPAEPMLTIDERAKLARLQGDLVWLVREGYVTEFIDGRLFAPPAVVEARKKEVRGPGPGSRVKGSCPWLRPAANPSTVNIRELLPLFPASAPKLGPPFLPTTAAARPLFAAPNSRKKAGSVSSSTGTACTGGSARALAAPRPSAATAGWRVIFCRRARRVFTPPGLTRHTLRRNLAHVSAPIPPRPCHPAGGGAPAACGCAGYPNPAPGTPAPIHG